MTTTTITRPGRPAELAPDLEAAPAESTPTPAPAAAGDTVRSQNEKLPELPLAGRLRLNLSALGIDPDAPDLGERLCQLSQDNEPYDFEISAQGELIVMAPSSWESNIGEKGINAPLFFWCMDNDGFDVSQTVMFRLPSGARYMPDAAWITQERYEQLLAEEYRSTIDGAPDFVVEVRSRTDNLADGLSKMQEWMDGGSRLGWYLDPYNIRAYIFRQGQAVEVLDNPETLSGEEVLPGFVFEVRRLIFARYAGRSQLQTESEPEPQSELEPGSGPALESVAEFEYEPDAEA